MHHSELFKFDDVTEWDLYATSIDCILNAKRKVLQIQVTRRLGCGTHWSYSQLYSSALLESIC